MGLSPPHPPLSTRHGPAHTTAASQVRSLPAPLCPPNRTCPNSGTHFPSTSTGAPLFTHAPPLPLSPKLGVARSTPTPRISILDTFTFFCSILNHINIINLEHLYIPGMRCDACDASRMRSWRASSPSRLSVPPRRGALHPLPAAPTFPPPSVVHSWLMPQPCPFPQARRPSPSPSGTHLPSTFSGALLAHASTMPLPPGEAPFIKRSINAHFAEAERKGVKIVHSCGWVAGK